MEARQTSRMVQSGLTHQHRFPCSEYLGRVPATTAFDQDQGIFLEQSIALREIEGIKLQLPTLRIRQMHSDSVTLHHAPNARRNSAKQSPELQVRDDLVVQLQQQLQPVLFALQDPPVSSAGPRN